MSNTLIHGDNRVALSDLNAKVKLVYIDPPYFTKEDFYADNTRTTVAFSDKWRNLDVYLETFYSQLILLHGLLTSDGSIFVHCDHRMSYHLRLILAKVFDSRNFRNELIVKTKANKAGGNKHYSKVRKLQNEYNSILVYAKSPETAFNKVVVEAPTASKTARWDCFYRPKTSCSALRYDLLGFSIDTGHWLWCKERAYKAIENYRKYLDNFADTMSLLDYWIKTGKCLEFIRDNAPCNPQYWLYPQEEVWASNLWLDIKSYNYKKDYAYPTAKSECLLDRIITMGSNKNDIVLDCFSGSGTTAAVAEKLDRQWIAIDNSKLAIDITKRRLEDLHSEFTSVTY